jgi:hypothetical protein
MEHHHLYRSGVVSAITNLDANDRLANVQSMLWQPHLVSYAIRSSDTLHFVHSGLLLPAARCHNQHPTDEDFQNGPQ